MSGVHWSHDIKETSSDRVEAVDVLAIKRECDILVIQNEGCIENCNIVMVEAEKRTVEGIGNGFAVREGGDGVWMRHSWWMSTG